MEKSKPKSDKDTFCKRFYKKHNLIIRELAVNFVTILVYGLLINIMLTGIFNLPFTLMTFIAYGLAYYFIMEELQVLVAKIRK
jgi:hypothetical protein